MDSQTGDASQMPKWLLHLPGPCWSQPNEGLCGQIPNMPLRAITSLYIEHVPLIWNSEEKETKGPTLYILCLVCFSVVLLGRETGSLHLLASLLLTGEKGADLVIRGNVVLNTLSARSTSTLLRDQICINSSSSRQVIGLAELSYATGFDYPLRNRTVFF
jgi:hypothetical protein